MVRRVLSACQKPRRVCAVHGANEVKIIFSGGKWVRLQERAARLVNKRESKSLILLLELIQRSRTHAAHSRKKLFSPCKLGETPIVQALRGTIGQVEPMQRCGISVPKAQKLCAQQGASPSNESPAKRVSFERGKNTFLPRSNSVTERRHAVLECQKASQSLRRARRK